jgi:phage-related protein
MIKDLEFIGHTLDIIKDFPEVARREAGYQLSKVQDGLEPFDWKPMTSIGLGVKEIRIQKEGQYRVIYIAKLSDAVYVLHAFEKKTQKTNQHNIDIAKAALKKVLAQKGKLL